MPITILDLVLLGVMSSLYADIGGPNSLAAVKMAVEDSGLKAKGWTINVLSGDHQNKPDIGVNIARQWIDAEKVDAIADTPNSGVALAVNNLVKEKNSVLLNSGAATADLTGKACTPNTVSYTYDTYMLANGTGKALTNKKLIGARDPLGIRPLVLGDLDGHPILASETCALDMVPLHPKRFDTPTRTPRRPCG